MLIEKIYKGNRFSVTTARNGKVKTEYSAHSNGKLLMQCLFVFRKKEIVIKLSYWLNMETKEETYIM